MSHNFFRASMCIFCNLFPCERHLPVSFRSRAVSRAWSQQATTVGASAPFQAGAKLRGPPPPAGTDHPRSPAQSCATPGSRRGARSGWAPWLWVLIVPESFRCCPGGWVTLTKSFLSLCSPNRALTKQTKGLCLSRQEAPAGEEAPAHRLLWDG